MDAKEERYLRLMSLQGFRPIDLEITREKYSQWQIALTQLGRTSIEGSFLNQKRALSKAEIAYDALLKSLKKVR